MEKQAHFFFGRLQHEITLQNYSKVMVMYRRSSVFTNPTKPSITSLSACEHMVDFGYSRIVDAEELGLHFSSNHSIAERNCSVLPRSHDILFFFHHYNSAECIQIRAT